MADLPKGTPITDEDLRKRALDNLDVLDRRGKLRVLDFTSDLVTGNEAYWPRDTRAALLAFAGTIPKEDLDEIEKIIEEEFEKVDEEGW